MAFSNREHIEDYSSFGQGLELSASSYTYQNCQTDLADSYDAPFVERNLLAAIVQMAIMDLRNKTERDDAIEWLTDSYEPGTPWTFGWICDQLDMDYESMMRGVYDKIKEADMLFGIWQQRKYLLALGREYSYTRYEYKNRCRT